MRKSLLSVFAAAAVLLTACEPNKESAVAVTGLKLNHESLILVKGQTEVLKSTVSPDNATNSEVVWSSSAPKIVSVTDAGDVTALNVGDAVITAATKDGDFKADCKIEVIVLTAGVVINKKETTIERGGTETLKATVAPEEASQDVVWESADETIATVDANGVVAALKKGTVTITAWTVDRKYSGQCEVTVIVKVESVSLNKKSATISKNGPEQLIATVLPVDATDKSVTWHSSDSAVATVSADGTVTVLKAGETTITVTTVDQAKSDECVVTATAPIDVTDVSLNKTSETVGLSESGYALIATVSPANASVRDVAWSSSDETVAEVDANGVVTPRKMGTTTITVTTADQNKTATCALTVNLIGRATFRTAQTWIVGTQTWSDAVVATGCQKENFNGGGAALLPDCRKNVGYGDFFSLQAVVENASAICPDGYRVPTQADFIALDKGLGGTGEAVQDAALLAKYMGAEWGGQYGGGCVLEKDKTDPTISNVGQMGMYWSSTIVESSYAYTEMLMNTGVIYPCFQPQAGNYGMTVRCVKDAN